MAATTTVTKVKTALRISHTALDSELGSLIDACLRDLEISGIKYPNENDELIYNAISLYCRINTEDDQSKATALQERYNALKASLQMSTGYGL